MPKEWIDIADTVVKIGLGSLITGTFTYLGIKLNKESDLSKHFVEHKTKLIEQAMKDSQEYFAAMRVYLSCVGGLIKQIKNVEEIDIPIQKKQLLKERNLSLQDSWHLRDKAVSTLSLLGAKKSVDLLIETSVIEEEIREIIVFNQKLPPYSEYSAFKVAFNNKVKDVQDEISSFYNNFYKD